MRFRPSKYERMLLFEVAADHGSGARRCSPGTVSTLNKKIYAQIEAWRNRPIDGSHPYLYPDGIVLKRSWAGEVRNVSLLVAIGVNDDGCREHP